MQRILIAAAVLVCLCHSALADSWVFPKEVKTKNYEFGKSKLVVEIDSMRDQGYPDFSLSIFLDGDLKAKYRNVGFTDIFASDDQQYFVGLSNSGIPDTAFVVFDARGNLLREVKHRFLPIGIYTAMSVTLRRVWFDAIDPAVEFKVEAGHLAHVLVRGSNKQQYDLLKPDLGYRPEATKE